MTNELWQLYLQLQTTYAYTRGVQLRDGSMPNYGLDLTDPVVWGLPTVPDPRCLIIGPGGTGEVCWLRRLVPGAEIHVLTAHKPELEELSGVHVFLGDIHNMPYVNGIYDYILALNVLEHCFAPYIALMECRRVLKETGTACFLMPSFHGSEGGIGPFHLHCLTEEVWGQLLVKVGLDAIATAVLHGDVQPEDFYLKFLCRAVTPPPPHDQILRDIQAQSHA